MRTSKDLSDLLDIQLSSEEDLATVKLPSPELAVWWKNYNDRILSLDCDIDEGVLQFIRLIIRFNQEDKEIKDYSKRKPIRIYITSYGGSVDVGNALISAIQLSKTPVYVYGIGPIASMAALIFISGHKRYALPMSSFLIHQGSASLGGNMGSVLDTADNFKRLEADVKKYILSRTKIDSKLYAKKVKTEWYLTPEEALELGVCDEIVNDIDILY